MTTYTVTGLAVYRDPASDVVSGVDNTGVTLEIVVPDTTTSFRYTVEPLGPGQGPGDEVIDAVLEEYTIRINGMTVNDATFDPFLSIFEVHWREAGASRISTVLIPSNDATLVPGLGLVDADYVFVIDGAPLPDITSPAAWGALEATITAIAVPAGAFGPGVDIPLTGLGAAISQNDIITGTAARDLFKSGAGADDVSGGGGNDTLRGEGGRDRLSGDAGRDKLFGGGGNDTLKGGGGKDRLDGGAGNDRMVGGGGADTFIFSRGADRISDFNAASNREKIDLSGVASIKNFRDLKTDHLSEVGGAVVIGDADGNTLTLTGLTIGDLDRGDFIF